MHTDIGDRGNKFLHVKFLNHRHKQSQFCLFSEMLNYIEKELFLVVFMGLGIVNVLYVVQVRRRTRTIDRVHRF